MTDAKALPRIKSVTAGLDYRVAVIWQDGRETNIDLASVVKSGGVFAPLRDKDLFATVQVGERGRTLEWPDPRNPSVSFADFDADVLNRMATEQVRLSFIERFFNNVFHRSHAEHA